MRLVVTREYEIGASLDGMGRLTISPSGKIGLGPPPFAESKPFLLRMIRMLAPASLVLNGASDRPSVPQHVHSCGLKRILPEF